MKQKYSEDSDYIMKWWKPKLSKDTLSYLMKVTKT